MKMKHLFLLPITALLISLASCQKNAGPDMSIKYDELTPVTVDDNYRTWYQIFPITFADSNNDGCGDLQGIINKLDYLKDMNYNGIWLCPIHPSTYYHHYDVEDYYEVDPLFGDLDVFDSLVNECHKRDIKLIIDLVINHSSNNHPWFKNSYKYAKAGDYENKWARLYNWVDVSDGYVPYGYSKVNSSDSVAYEARFGGGMPDLNLQPVLDDPENSDIASRIKKIVSFWLIDHNVDGFRLDAITHYFENEQTKNLQFMTWFNNECKALKQDCYIVGEGNWGSNSAENKLYQSSGIDSIFQFGNSVANGSFIKDAVISNNAKKYYSALGYNEENADGGIEAPFLGNHDIPRFVAGVQGRKNASNTKFALGLLQMMRGSTFTYYGDEVGMASQSTVSDGWYRLPIQWGDNTTTDVLSANIIGVTKREIDESLSYPHGDVATQQSNANSVLNYAKKANLIRAAFPELARGNYSLTKEFNSKQIIIKRTYNGSTINVVINADTEQLTLDYKTYGAKVVAELCPEGKVLLTELDGTEINIPPKSIVIIK